MKFLGYKFTGMFIGCIISMTVTGLLIYASGGEWTRYIILLIFPILMANHIPKKVKVEQLE